MTAATTERTTVLNQILAVRDSVKTDAERKLTKNYHLLQRTELLVGQARSYSPHDDDELRLPDETTQVQLKVEQVLRSVADDLTQLFDVTAAMDWTNQHARADVVLLGGDQPVTLLTDVPTSYLLFLEKQLTNLGTLVKKLPVLAATESWTFDPATDTYKSQPIGTVKTKKIRKSHILYPATDKHQAQVESYTEDEAVGIWSTVKFSGALPAERINKMQERIRVLYHAVKYAREQANMEDVMQPNPGRRIFEYLFAA